MLTDADLTRLEALCATPTATWESWKVRAQLRTDISQLLVEVRRLRKVEEAARILLRPGGIIPVKDIQHTAPIQALADALQEAG